MVGKKDYKFFLLNFMFSILCAIDFSLIQQLHNQQQTIICPYNVSSTRDGLYMAFLREVCNKGI